MARRDGNASFLLVALLALAGVAGAYNYHRNLQIEEARPRPHAVYSDADLAALLEAYEAETAQWRAAHRGARGVVVEIDESARYDERVQQFEKAQRVGAHKRGVAGELATREAMLAGLQEEQRLRAQEPQGVALHLKRLLTL